MKDLQNSADIAYLMDKFYTKLLADPVVGYIFTDVAKLDLQKHLPSLTQFWSNTLFEPNGYKKNVLKIHQALDYKEKLLPAHFDRWIELLKLTLKENFEGEKADELWYKAENIRKIMQIKLTNN